MDGADVWMQNLKNHLKFLGSVGCEGLEMRICVYEILELATTAPTGASKFFIFGPHSNVLSYYL